MPESLGLHKVLVRAGDVWSQFIPAFWEGTGPLWMLWDTRIVRLFADGGESQFGGREYLGSGSWFGSSKGA